MATAKGTETLGVGINKELAAEFRAFATNRGETMREVLEAALRRHMDNPPPPAAPPPPPVYPPLPPVTPTGAAVEKPTGTPKPKGKK